MDTEQNVIISILDTKNMISMTGAKQLGLSTPGMKRNAPLHRDVNDTLECNRKCDGKIRLQYCTSSNRHDAMVQLRYL